MNANCGAIPLLDGANAAGVAPGAGAAQTAGVYHWPGFATDLPTWHNYETILDNVHLIVCRRPGYPLTMAQEADQRWLDRHLTHDVESLHNRPSGVIYLAETPWFDISATIIRQRLERGESCAEMLPAAVLDYIREQGLYC